MQISSDSWHARVYINWFRRKKGWTPTEANLCPYVRAVLLYSWLRYIFLTGTIWPAWTLLGLSLEGFLLWWRLLPTLQNEGIILLCATIVFIWFGILYFMNIGFETAEKSSFVNILKERVRSAHSGICPTINFK